MKELRDNGVLDLDINGNNVELTEEDLLSKQHRARAMYQKQTVKHP